MPGIQRLISLTFVTFAAFQLADAANLTTRNLVARGNIEYRKLDFTKALAKYDAAIKKDGKYAIAYNNRGLALHKLGRLDEAIDALKKAIEIGGKKSGARALLKTPQLDGKNATFQLNLGKVYATNRQFDLALAAFAEALKLQRGFPAAIYNRAWVLDEQKDIVRAAEAASLLRKLKKPLPGSKLLTGIIAAHGGDARELSEATFATDDLPQLWRWLGEFNRCLGTGGVAELKARERAALRQAIFCISTEQFAAGRVYLESVNKRLPTGRGSAAPVENPK